MELNFRSEVLDVFSREYPYIPRKRNGDFDWGRHKFTRLWWVQTSEFTLKFYEKPSIRKGDVVEGTLAVRKR